MYLCVSFIHCLCRNHLATQSQRNRTQSNRNSFSLEVNEFKQHCSRRRSESLDLPENRPSLFNHRRNLSMEPQELARDLAAAVDGLSLLPLCKKALPMKQIPMNVDLAHDYAEIYTPSREKAPIWLKGGPPSGSSSTTSDSVAELGIARAPTPPLHRLPSWEAKIYQVAKDGLELGDEPDTQFQDQDPIQMQISRSQQTASGGYCDISVPVYATVKGVSSEPKHPKHTISIIISGLFEFSARLTNTIDAVQWRIER